MTRIGGITTISSITIGFALALAALGPRTTVRAAPSQDPAVNVPIEITIGKLGRYPMSSLSREWFFLNDRDLFIHAPGKTDMNQWLANLKGLLAVMAVPGTVYNPRSFERVAQGEVIYSLMPSTNTHNFFIGDSGIALVVAEVGKDPDSYIRKKRLVDKLMEVAGKPVVLILRQVVQ